MNNEEIPGVQEIDQQIADLQERRRKCLELQDHVREKKHEIDMKVAVNPLAFYKPSMPNECFYGDSQYSFLVSIAKERWISGGNRSGKTDTVCTDLAYHITGDYPDWYPKAGRIMDGEKEYRPLMIRLFATDFKEGVEYILWEKLMQKLPFELRVDPKRDGGKISSAAFPNGVKCIFGTYGQKQQAPAGTASHLIVLDEPPDSKNRYEEIIRGSIDNAARIIMSFTPIDCDWIAEDMKHSTADVNAQFELFVTYLDIRDNKHLPKDHVNWFVNRLSEEERVVRVKGKPRSYLDRVYMNFDKLIHVCAPFELPTKNGRPDGWSLFFALDPHDSNPPAMVWYIMFDPKLGGGISKIFVIREDWTPGLIIPAAVNKIIEIEHEIGARAIGRVADPNYSVRKQGYTGNQIIQDYQIHARRAGYPMYFRMGDERQHIGHTDFKTLLDMRMPAGAFKGRAVFEVFSSCELMTDSFAGYKWKDKQKEIVVDDKHKHWQDLNRYFYRAGFKYMKDDSETLYERFKDAKMSELAAAGEAIDHKFKNYPVLREDFETLEKMKRRLLREWNPEDTEEDF